MRGFRCTNAKCNHVAWDDTSVNGCTCPICKVGEMNHDIDVPFGELEPFTGLGGYTIVYLPKKGKTQITGDELCAKCAMEERDRGEMEHGMLRDTYDEGPVIFCDGCNCEIESSYGDPDAKEVN